jgi:hypothetical protein
MNILKICEQKFKYLNYSKNTSKVYIKHIDEFVIKINKYPQLVSFTTKYCLIYINNVCYIL